MMGMHDGVSKLWILRFDHGLDMDGHVDECSAIDSLIRRALSFGPPETRARIEATVEKAIKHLEPRIASCNKHEDCRAAEQNAKDKGLDVPTHCHSDDCEECFGS